MEENEEDKINEKDHEHEYLIKKIKNWRKLQKLRKNKDNKVDYKTIKRKKQ